MLTIIQVGDNPASNVYIRNKIKAIEEAGLEVQHLRIDGGLSTGVVTHYIREAARYASAILVQLPLPPHINKDEVLRAIPEHLDIDGLNPRSDYKPLTPCAIMRWLREKGVELEGKNVTILGRSELVGKPLANMMIDAGATVTVCNSHTPYIDSANFAFLSDIVISAVGKKNMVSWKCVSGIRKQIFIDVGINRTEDGKLCGDLSKKAKEYITEAGSEYTPVPGGVGKWTVRELVLRLAEMEGTRNE